MKTGMRFLRTVFRAAARWVAHSVWWPLAGKALAGAVALAALAHVGSGAAANLRAAPTSSASTQSAVPPRSAQKQGAGQKQRASKKQRAAPATSAHDPCKRNGEPAKPTRDAWTRDGKLILNRANAADFRKLPRIGKKRAEAILALRTKLGRFKRVRDLLRIRGIGYRMLQALKPLVVVDAPKDAP